MYVSSCRTVPSVPRVPFEVMLGSSATLHEPHTVPRNAREGRTFRLQSHQSVATATHTTRVQPHRGPALKAKPQSTGPHLKEVVTADEPQHAKSVSQSRTQRCSSKCCSFDVSQDDAENPLTSLGSYLVQATTQRQGCGVRMTFPASDWHEALGPEFKCS